MLTTDPPTSASASAATSTPTVSTMPAAEGGNANGINPKLLHLVQKIVSHAQATTTTTTSTATTPKKPTLEYVIHCLRTQNVEYQRKNMDRLKKQVETALTYVLKNQQEQPGNNNKKNQTPFNSPAAGGLGKRSRSKQKQNTSSSEQKEEEQQQQQEEVSSEEEADRLYDAQREQIVDNSALNASLRKRYEKLQKDRDAAAAAEAAALAAAAASKLAEENANNKLSEENANNSNAGDSTNNKSRKRKLSERRKSKSSSSSSKRAQLGNGNFMDGDDDDKASLLRPVPRPVERYSDLGGMDKVLKQIRELVEYPLVRPELYAHLGVGPPRGILLQGPPGTGKSHLANAIAGQLGVTYYKVSAPELVSGMSGESEGRIRDLFRAAADTAPSILFMDELDAIAPKRSEAGSSRGMEKRMVAQLLTSMDLLDPKYTRNQAPVIVLGATNRPDALDSALRRAGRFDKEILLGVPDEEAREKILRTMTKGMRLSGDFDFKVLARKTPGFVGADVRSLTKEAAVIAINRIFRDVLLGDDINASDPFTHDKLGGAVSDSGEITDGAMADNETTEPGATSTIGPIRPLEPLTPEQLEPLYVQMEDFLEAIPLVQPSGKREGFAVAPDVTWDDIGAMHEIRDELTMSVLEPIRNPEKFKILGLSLPAGVLLYGPPGCGKTLLAKAVASESGANFISVKGPELLDKYVGESERAVRLVFERARSSSPCVIFFDELDSLCPKRGSDGGGSGVSERVVNQLLTEMDGLESRRSVFVIAATNRPELIDPAMMRPGRLDKLLYVPLPSPDDRVQILSALSTNIRFGTDVDMNIIGRSSRAEGFSGADCAALLREAGLAVLKEDLAASAAGDTRDSADLCIAAHHFDYAFDHVMPSVSTKDQARYDRIRQRMARARTRGSVSDAEVKSEPGADRNDDASNTNENGTNNNE